MSDDVLEKVRMCVAEAGHDPSQVGRSEFIRSGIKFGDTPVETQWRAMALAGFFFGPICLQCWMTEGVTVDDCAATTPLVGDCGVAR